MELGQRRSLTNSQYTLYTYRYASSAYVLHVLCMYESCRNLFLLFSFSNFNFIVFIYVSKQVHSAEFADVTMSFFRFSKKSNNIKMFNENLVSPFNYVMWNWITPLFKTVDSHTLIHTHTHHIQKAEEVEIENEWWIHLDIVHLTCDSYLCAKWIIEMLLNGHFEFVYRI